MRKQFGRNKIIILLGAGASCDAGMFNSFQIINEIEKKLDDEWEAHKGLYNYIQSSHFHLERIKGVPAREIIFNIENLVGLLDTIIKISKKELDIYPFVGSWEKDLISVAGNNFLQAEDFKKRILSKLKQEWLSPVNFKTTSAYYKKLKETGYNHPLKIFSLNYDMCVEENLENDRKLERGFNDQKIWDYRQYDLDGDNLSDFYLYKLHGSLDWFRDDEKRLTYVDLVERTDPQKMEIIFGVQNKLQSYDPYMFYFYALREAAFEAELIVISGYGFMDKHINDNLTNAFKLDSNRRLLVNIFEKNDSEDEKKIEERTTSLLAERLQIQPDKINIINSPAKDFFENKLNVDFFSSLFPDEIQEEELPL
jgi:hypothetical protein